MLVAARQNQGLRRYLLVTLGALCATLAVVAKVQAILPVLFIPAIVVAFGYGQEAGDRDLALAGRRGWMLAAGATLLAAVAAYPAIDLLRLGIAGGMAVYRPLGLGLSGVYQWLIGLWVTGAVVAYAFVRRTPAAVTVTVLACVALGVGVGLSSLLIYYDIRNVMAVANPIEHMFVFASADTVMSQQTQVLSTTLFATLAAGVGRVLAVHGFVFSPSGRPNSASGMVRHRRASS